MMTCDIVIRSHWCNVVAAQWVVFFAAKCWDAGMPPDKQPRSRILPAKGLYMAGMVTVDPGCLWVLCQWPFGFVTFLIMELEISCPRLSQQTQKATLVYRARYAASTRLVEVFDLQGPIHTWHYAVYTWLYECFFTDHLWLDFIHRFHWRKAATHLSSSSFIFSKKCPANPSIMDTFFNICFKCINYTVCLWNI